MNNRNVYVVGGANIDIFGIPNNKLVRHDSNIGTINYSYGGVGRNIAENLAKLGHPVRFISAIGGDDFGKSMMTYCEAIGMDMSHVLTVPYSSTSTYLALLDEKKDMDVAINDMSVLENLTPDYLEPIFKTIQSDDILVIDTNLDQSLIDWMFENAPCKIFLDPISCAKIGKVKHHLDKIYTFKPNIYEAKYLLDSQSNDPYTLASALIKQGVKRVFLSLGEDGLFYMDEEMHYHVKARCDKMVNATGAGDSSTAAMISAYLKGYDLKTTLKYATTVAILTIESETTVCGTLTEEDIKEREARLEFTWL